MAKHKYIESPEVMWELFQAYTKHTKSNPFIIEDYVGAIAKEVERKKEKPLTMEGFECYVFNQNLNGDLHHYFSNYEDRYADYIPICSRIRKAIRLDQIEGGMAGMYNPSITQRLNALVEKTQTDSNIEIKGLPIQINTNSPPLANDEK